ncbi:AT-rich interactive domain-containing protein 5B [Oryzias melastigma]|uniref:AT-rich interactive domain-containing protein 5B n=1 Tax=Oryzias melastigma TaxID=30732 RepID=A0A834C5B8_ORYME|nr:AT-rich interactive domain-containing protein 5B [Oryzias melastigma]
MEHTKLPEEETKNPTEDITEEQFLKDLYTFMKKRDTPIERIPNLGFKQIDLFVMFKTVNDLGGYHQVTSHQLWKQVYNVLGGNPRSTSAATCTRRHYERLLLPYECHLKGILINAVPQPKPYHDKDNSSGQRPSKRRLLTHQGSFSFQFDPYFHSLPLQFPQFYPPSQPFLPPIFPLLPSVLEPPHVLKPTVQLQPPTLDPDTNQSLKELRQRAKEYTSSFRQNEPLNLSTKASSCDSESPASSFSTPASNKSPKFLNKPSTLYAPRQSGVVRNEETGDSSEEDTAFLYPPKAKKAHVVRAFTPPHSPECSSEADEGVRKPSSLKSSPLLEPAEVKQEERQSSVSDSQPQPGEGRMEFKVPLSVFYKLLKSCGPPAMLSPSEDASGQRSCSDVEATQIFYSKRQNSAEDLSQKNEANSYSQSHLRSYKPFPSGSSPNATWPHDPQDPRRHWDNTQTRASSNAVRTDSSPLRDFSSRFHEVPEAEQRGERKPPALLRNPNSVLDLTSEELVKLRRIILSTS